MNGWRAALAASVASLLLAPPAAALEAPAESERDPRVRTVAYDPNQVTKLYAAPGATLTIQLAPGETVAGLPVSDQSLLDAPKEDNAPAGPLALVGGPSERTGAGHNASADRNLFTAVRGNFVMLKPLRELDPQPLFVIGKAMDATTGKEVMRAYTFELSTRTGPLTKEAPDTYYLVRFTYPAEERAAASAAAAAKRQAGAAAAAARRASRETLRVRQRLATPQPAVINTNYDGQGDRDLAPSPTATEPAMWDDGQSTFLRFPGNRRLPTFFVIHPDKREASVNYSVATNGVVTLHQTAGEFRLRDGNRVLCIFNRAFDPTGRNPGTGTTSADVVREARP